MLSTNRYVVTMVATLAAAPLAAQGRRGGVTPPTTPPATAATQQPAQRPGLDFQNQQVSVVITALAEAGGVGVSLNNMPNATTTLHMGPAPSKAEVIAMIKAIADANSIRIGGSDALLVLTGPPIIRPRTQQELQYSRDSAMAELNKQSLHTYQLKHSSAATLAPVLTALFQATGGRGGGGTAPVTNTNAARGGAANQTQNRGAAQGGGARGGGGRGGGGGDLMASSPNMIDMTPPVEQIEVVPASLMAAISDLPAGDLRDRILEITNQQIGGAPVTFTTQAQGAQNPLQQLQNLFGGGANNAANQVQSPRIIADQLTNKLMVMASDADWLKIQEVLKDIDLRPLQVLIEVTIAEVTRSEGLSIGLSGKAAHKSGLQSDTATLNNGSASAARDFILKMVGSKGAIDYNVALNALQSRGNVKVLSLPMVVAQNNQLATLNVGQSIPFPAATSTTVTGGVPSTTTTYNFQDVGTILNITPTINRDGYVNMVVSQTDNTAAPDAASGLYIVSEREASTTVFLRDGQTTVLGGLAGKSTNKSSSGIPILSSIPIIGPILFGNRSETAQTSELFLFLTPHIISEDEDIDRLREAVKGSAELLRDVPIGQRINPDSTRKPPVASTTGGGGRR